MSEHSPTESGPKIYDELPIPAGTKVTLTKPGETKGGAVIGGKIFRLQPIRFDDGSNTSNVREIRFENGTWKLRTDSSEYVMTIVEPERNVVVESELGSIETPQTMKDAVLPNEPYDHTFGPHRIRINTDALRGVLQEVEGGQIFRAMEGRFFVLAKVGNIHVPFYMSSAGTSGKNEGEWYPFFGHTGEWLAKGRVGKDGEMVYHPEISNVQALLNENLQLPVETGGGVTLLSPQGKFGIGKSGPFGVEPAQVLFDINDHLAYRNFILTPEGKASNKFERDDIAFAQRITGYRPSGITKNTPDLTERWIKEVTSRI